jgi:uncharacterized protein (UPF0548 family)
VSTNPLNGQEQGDTLIRLLRPTTSEISPRLASLDAPLSYPEVGATANLASLGALAVEYDVDRHQFALGTGRELFERARSALFAWRQFEIPWLQLHGAEASPHPGQVVATLTRVAGVWFLNPCRVVYTEGESAVSREAAFAYGTIAGHVESGEERFAVRFDPATAEVTYEVLAFSRPAVLLTALTKHWVRRLQRRFATSSADALARACRPVGAAAEPLGGRRSVSHEATCLLRDDHVCGDVGPGRSRGLVP